MEVEELSHSERWFASARREASKVWNAVVASGEFQQRAVAVSCYVIAFALKHVGAREVRQAADVVIETLNIALLDVDAPIEAAMVVWNVYGEEEKTEVQE